MSKAVKKKLKSIWRKKISYLCGNCNRNSLLDTDVKFVVEDTIVKIYGHDICSDCYPIIATKISNEPRYKERIKNIKYTIKED